MCEYVGGKKCQSGNIGLFVKFCVLIPLSSTDP